MAIRFWRWLTGKASPAPDTSKAIGCKEVAEAAVDFALRDLCYRACVDMIANAIGRCEFRTFKDGAEVRDREYYMLNVEPNVNQNSSAFWHKVVSKLYADNEALIISTVMRDGRECLVCADSYTYEGGYPQKMNEYTNIQVGNVTYNKKFKENSVLHLKLNERDIKPVLDALYLSYAKLLETARQYYATQNGAHVKVHIGTIPSQEPGFEEKFRSIIERDVLPYLKSSNGVLPEFDGYEYTKLDLGSGTSSSELRDLSQDIFDYTARALLIPTVLINGNVEGTEDANKRFLTYVIDPLCDQLQEEINRKRYGFDSWKSGTFVRVDSTSILHFDIFENAANIEKVVGSSVFSVNDVLRAANLPEISEPWADSHYMTLNISTIGAQTRNMEGGDSE